jgi:hypothetical protein
MGRPPLNTNQHFSSKGNLNEANVGFDEPDIASRINSWKRNTSVYDVEIRLVGSVETALGARRYGCCEANDVVVSENCRSLLECLEGRQGFDGNCSHKDKAEELGQRSHDARLQLRALEERWEKTVSRLDTDSTL